VELGEIELPPLFQRRYNIAPTQQAAILRQDAEARAMACTWGFDLPGSGAPAINARCETLREKPLFRDLVDRNRCLVIADGFYEWKARQPYYFQLDGGSLFAFAGLWRDDRFVILTRAADASMQGIHHRMPIIFPLADGRSWLEGFHIPASPPTLVARPVSRRVNSVAHDDPACLGPSEVQENLDL